LDTFRGDYTYFFTVPSVIVDFLKTEGEAKTLANPRIRVLDNKQAEVTIGEKFPIQLSTTTTTAATTTAAIAGQTTTQSTEFKDVAIKLGVKPRILLNNDVTLELTLEITSLGSFEERSQQFRFGNRSAKTVLNVKNGETVVIGGLMRDEDRISYNKIPGLGDIPLLGKFFSSTDKSKFKSDIIMTLTPHVIRGLEAPEKDLQYFWSGTEETYSTRPLFSELLTTGEVRPEEGPGGNAPVPGPPLLPPFLVPPGPLPPAPEIPTPSTLLPRRSSQSNRAIEPPATVVLYPQEARVSVSQEVTVGVMVNNATQLSEAVLSLAYDPALLEFRRATEGDLMGRDGLSTSFVSSTNPSTGLVDVRIKRLADKRGINGSGTLFSLVFSGKQAGASPIAFKEGHLLTPIEGALAVNLARGQVTVQ
ncbi:MAG TPA: cohesin domain-containing protein, partial [Nitrospiria bacterium]|nr:cohesin domain-containing protein [Nitrospiria bacterium]